MPMVFLLIFQVGGGQTEFTLALFKGKSTQSDEVLTEKQQQQNSGTPLYDEVARSNKKTNEKKYF